MTKTPQVTEALKLAVKAYLLAKAFRETMEKKIIPIQKAVLNELQIFTSGQIIAWGEQASVILNPQEVYLASDEDATKYFTKLHGIYNQMGYELEYGYCPLCTAEYEEMQAQWEIFKNLEFIKLTFDQANSLMGESRQKLLSLICGLVISVTPKEFFKLEVTK